MDFRERLKKVNEVLKGSGYSEQKEIIKNLFEKTDGNKKEDISLRLVVIDSYYSTNMSKRKFWIEDLSKLILEIKGQLTDEIDVMQFVKRNFDKIMLDIGIDKKGNPLGHALSLITKYIYYQTKFNFPIYDSLVKDGLIDEGLISKTFSIKYFEKLSEIKNKYKISYDDLDKYFWVIGKIKSGNLSLLISDSKIYINDFIKNLNLTEVEKKYTSNEFDDLVSKKLVSDGVSFQDEKLSLIKELAISINNDGRVINMK